MVFVVDDLGAWLVAMLADAGRKRLTTVVLGSDQERALRQAAATAIKLAAADLYPESDSRAEDLAIVVNQVFGEPLSDSPKPVQATLLEELRAGIARQLAPLDDASLTGTRQSSADVLGVSAGTLAQKLAGHLVREIVVRGARGGPLAPLAAQLNHDVTHLQGQRIEDVLGRLDDEVRKALARLDATQRPATAPTVLAQLPPAMTGFTGRDGDLELLMELLDPGNTAGPVVVSAVAGLAGVGKTALAVEAGHAAQRHGWFPGGVLFLDLHGYDDQPTEPSQALDALLRALGLPADRIPLSADERAALYRSVLANTSDPVLVIADNASSEAQVRPMLPGVGPHKVLATSRNTLAALGARLVDVAVLEKQAAVDLLEAALQAARPEDDRLRGDLVAVGQLAEICGGLPLALQIAAALLKADPGLSVAELADELSIESERLEQLQYDDGSGLDAPSVATAFELSYRRLNHTMARLFRLLPLNPGPDVSTAAVAVMAAMPTREVRTGLAGLVQAHLADAAPSSVGRWRMHDLLRLYAQRLSDAHADEDSREQAIDRLLDYYLTMARTADDHLRALRGAKVPTEFPSRDAALAWLDAERACLVAAVTMAAETGRDEVALHLPMALADYFNRRRRLDDKLTTSRISLEAARRLDDRLNEAMALTNLGETLGQARRFQEAISAHQHAAAVFQEIGHRRGKGMALDNLGIVMQALRRFQEAISAHRDAVVIFRETGDRHSEGMALNNLGAVLNQAGRSEEAVTVCRVAAAIYQETGDRRREGNALNNLGLALQGIRRFKEAVTALEAAAAVYRETGDRYGEGRALANVGSALVDARQFEEAVSACQAAAAIFRDANDRHDEGIALNTLGKALLQVRRSEEAIIALQGAAAAFRDTSDQYAESVALRNLERATSGRPT